MRATDAAAQLVQLREAEFVGAVNQNRIRAWHVNTGFDNRRAYQHIRALRHKIAHHPFERALVHLAVRHQNTRLWQQRFKRFAARIDGFYFIVQKVDLPAALEFAQRRLANHAVFLAPDKGFNRQPFCGAVAITEKSRNPSSASPSVRGIGVAVSVSTSTCARSAFSCSFWRTPKRCSSSMITSPSRLKRNCLDKS